MVIEYCPDVADDELALYEWCCNAQAQLVDSYDAEQVGC